MLAVAVILLCLAVAAVAVGIARVNVRLVGGGCAVAGAIWLGCGWLTENEEADSIYQVVTLRLRAIDAATGAAVANIAANAHASAEGSEPVSYRLPASVVGPAGPDNGEILLVSIIVEVRLSGSLVDRMRDPAAHAELIDQTIEFNAAGYRPLRRTLSQLLPAGWPYAKLTDAPIEVELERE